MTEEQRKRKPEAEENKAVDTKSIKVRVGYGWQKFDGDESERKGRDVLLDTFWKSLQQIFKPPCDKFKDAKNSHGISVEFGRLRAKHGCLIWPTIAERIAQADVLIFDVAAAPKKDISDKSGDLNKFVKELNANVLLEIGYALGCQEHDKRVVLMCPKHLFGKIPSDLRGFFWTLYTGRIEKGEVERTLVDAPGTINAFRGMLRDIANKKAERLGED